VRFQLWKNGELVDQEDDVYSYVFSIDFDTSSESDSNSETYSDLKSHVGNYRIVAFLKFGENWLPWVFTNPIYVYL